MVYSSTLVARQQLAVIASNIYCNHPLITIELSRGIHVIYIGILALLPQSCLDSVHSCSVSGGSNVSSVNSVSSDNSVSSVLAWKKCKAVFSAVLPPSLMVSFFEVGFSLATP